MRGDRVVVVTGARLYHPTMIVTIDGPAGSGKSTAARKLAAKLEIAYLDTGAMYRALALAALRAGIDLSNPSEANESLAALARGAELELDCGPTFTRVRLDGHDVSEAIRSMEVSEATSAVARCQAVRDLLVEKQRSLGASLGSCVSEGRDQGSVVFPNADAKFVLEASIERRAKRRLAEMIADGEEVSLEAVRANLEKRDRVDSRQWAPLLASGEAIVIDTTSLSISEVVEAILKRLPGS